MLLDKKRNREIAERHRRTRQTLLQSVFLIIASILAGGITYFIFTNDLLTTESFYTLGLPRAIPVWGIYFAMGFGILGAIQLLFSIGFMIGSPQGRRKAGTATLESSTADPNDNPFED